MTVFVQLAGGLGNQLFQCATGLAVARRTGCALVLDTWSGFVRDRWFRRQYGLQAYAVAARVATPLERVPVWLFRAESRVRPPVGLVTDRLYGRFLVEQARTVQAGLDEAVRERAAWLLGYWQSPRYFDDLRPEIQRTLMPPPPANPTTRALGTSMRAGASLAIGIRLYEESSDARLHAHDGRVKRMAEIAAAVDRVRHAQAGVRCYVFCTHRAPALAELGLPDDTVYLTGDQGFGHPDDSLWLLAQCRHHVLTNSTFYWWGAYLSAAVHGDRQHIVAADNFLNRDALLPTWETF